MHSHGEPWEREINTVILSGDEMTDCSLEISVVESRVAMVRSIGMPVHTERLYAVNALAFPGQIQFHIERFEVIWFERPRPEKPGCRTVYIIVALVLENAGVCKTAGRKPIENRLPSRSILCPGNMDRLENRQRDQ